MTIPLGRLAAAGAILVSLIAAGCSSAPTAVKAAVKPENERKVAPDFSLKDANGATVRLSDYRGKVVLLDFWATWCGPCKIEIPWFMDFEHEYKDRGFAVLGVSMDEDGWSAVKPYIEERKMNYRVMVGTEEISQPVWRTGLAADYAADRPVRQNRQSAYWSGSRKRRLSE